MKKAYSSGHVMVLRTPRSTGRMLSTSHNDVSSPSSRSTCTTPHPKAADCQALTQAVSPSQIHGFLFHFLAFSESQWALPMCSLTTTIFLLTNASSLGGDLFPRAKTCHAYISSKIPISCEVDQPTNDSHLSLRSSIVIFSLS